MIKNISKILRALALKYDYIITPGKELFMRPKINVSEGALPMTPQNLNNVIFSVIKESLSAAKKEFYHRAIWDEAKTRARESEVYVRVAYVEVNEGFIIFCDLGRAGFVKITPKSIKIVDSCPVPFLRPASMQSLPIPDWDKKLSPRDALKGLWDLVNVEPKDRRVVIAWLMAAFQQEGTRVALLLEGVQGSAKTTTLRRWRVFSTPTTRKPLPCIAKKKTFTSTLAIG